MSNTKVTKNSLRIRAQQVGAMLGYGIAVVDRRDGYALEVIGTGDLNATLVTGGNTAREADAFLRGMQVVAMGAER